MSIEKVTEQHFSVAVSQKAIDNGLLLENLLTRLGATDEGKAVLTGKRRVKMPNRVKAMWETMSPGDQLNFIIESFIETPHVAEAVSEKRTPSPNNNLWSRGL